MTDHAAAPGWSADWLNAWLAALGVTVLLPGTRLVWTDDPRPTAVFYIEDGTGLARQLAQVLPIADALGERSIARTPLGRAEFARTVTPDSYQDRASLERAGGDFTLGVTVTDLQHPVPAGGFSHSPFDPPAPQGITLFQRLIACREALTTDEEGMIAASLAGHGRRVPLNGLGFDCRRFVSGVQPAAKKSVDPVIECLAFFGLALFPIRGNGAFEQTRGWREKASKVGALTWPAWSQPLDRWAIDALLDQVPSVLDRASGAPKYLRRAARLGISALYQSVPYRWVSTSDVTRAYASHRVW